jgi:NhaA family Na+:H+ antiporter
MDHFMSTASTHAISHGAVARANHKPSTTRSMLHSLVDRCLLLPIGAAIAVAWAGLWPESYFSVSQKLAFGVNDVAMGIFFAFVTQELVEEVMPGGALHSWRRWTVPLIGAAGGFIASTLTFLAFVNLRHQTVLAAGWPVAGAIDVAFAYFIVKNIFRHHPAVPFLLLLAFATNVVGLAATAFGHQVAEIRGGGAALMAGAIGLAIVLRLMKVRTFWPYLVVCGAMSWWAFHLDGLHPALALVPIVPFLPHKPRNLDLFAESDAQTHGATRRFEHRWNHVVQIVLFFFGLVNAGVLLRGYGAGSWAVLTAALAGRPLGILAAIAVALAIGLRLPARLGWRDLVIVSVAASSGFTIALFFAVGVIPIGPTLGQLKIGALSTAAAAPLAIGLAYVLRVGRFANRSSRQHRVAHRHSND